MLDKQVIAYYATRSGYIFEPGIRVKARDFDEYVKGIRKAGDEVLPAWPSFCGRFSFRRWMCGPSA